MRVATFNILHGRNPADDVVDVATLGSAIAGLHRCRVQSSLQTPSIPHFNVTQDIDADYRSGWSETPPLASYVNPYRVGWEAFLRHVDPGHPLQSDFAAGMRDVAFAEACHRSMAERKWITFASE